MKKIFIEILYIGIDFQKYDVITKTNKIIQRLIFLMMY